MRRRIGVRGLLVTLVVATVLPMLASALLRANERADSSRKAVQDHALERARVVANAVDARVRHIRAVVAATAHAVSTDPADSLRNDTLLLALRQEAGAGYVSQLWVITPEGRYIGTSRRPRPHADLTRIGERLYFREVLRTRRPAVGEPVRTLTDSTDWSVTFAHPVLDSRGEVAAIVLGTVGLESLSPTLVANDMPRGSLITLIDGSGTVLGRSENPKQWIGRDISDHGNVRETLRRGTGVSESVDLEGRARLAAFSRATAVPWMIFAGIPAEVAYAETGAATRRDLALVAGALVLALGAALIVAGRLTRPLRALGDEALCLARNGGAPSGAPTRARAQGVRELAALGHAFDIMAQTVAARTAQLGESERRYRRLFDDSPLPLFVADLDSHRILAVNEAALAQYGYSREELLTLELADIRPPEERIRFLMSAHTLRQSHERGESLTPLVERHQRRDGSELEVQAYAVVAEYDGKPALVTTALDVTARRRTERALAESQERLRHVQKMEALGRFAGGIAHDFNNLLTGILGYCELALEGLSSDVPARADVEEIRRTSRRAADLTRQILAFSRRQVLQPSTLDLNEVVRDLTGVLERVTDDRIRLVLDLRADSPIVIADRTQLEQVLMNLVVNARDAMPDGGTLTIATANARDAELADGCAVRLVVTDTGIGMDESVRAQILEPFFTTKPRGKGTGLGLATVDGIVQQSGGLLRVRTAPGQGSSFEVSLPCAQRPGPPLPIVADGAPPGGGHETILLVDDDDAVRALAQSVLTRRGYVVLPAADAREALALEAGHEGEIHLLVTDVMMPGLNGRELAERLVGVRPDLRVLLVSGFTEDEQLHRGVSSRGLAFLAKPFTPELLERRVRDTLDGREPLEGSVAAAYDAVDDAVDDAVPNGAG